MDENERKIIVEELKVVDKVFMSIDDDKSVNKTILMIHENIQVNLNYFLQMVAIRIINIYQNL